MRRQARVDGRHLYALAGALTGLLACGGAPPPAAEVHAAAPASDPAAHAGADQTLPPGYSARPDDPKKSVADIKFTMAPTGTLDVNAGTHDQNLGHILYRSADTAHGLYTVRVDIEQLGAPEHPEAVGLFIGGQELAGPGQRYGYFIVRGDGQYAVKRRDMDSAFTIVPFTASAAIPKADTARRATYHLAVRVGADSVRFLVGGKPVAAVRRGAIPTDGIFGYRINHGLHVTLTPLALER